MKHSSIIQVAACAALFVAALAPRAVKADQWDKKTYLTFSNTVQVPGATLPAGKYVFKLLESPSDRYIVQVFNERENHIFATILAVPDYKLDVPEKTQITFYEAPVGQPLPIRSWFYPGDNYGRDFVYSKGEAALIAQAGNQNVATETTTAVAQNNEINTTETQAQQSAAVATEPEVESSKSVETPEPAPAVAEPQVTEPEPQTTESPRSDEVTTEQTPTDTAAPAPEPSTTMPATGSEMPMVLLVGLVSLAGAMTVRAARRVH